MVNTNFQTADLQQNAESNDITMCIHTMQGVRSHSRSHCLSGTLHKNYTNLHVAVHHTVTNLGKNMLGHF